MVVEKIFGFLKKRDIVNMQKNDKDFNVVCYDFQKKIIDTFNNEKSIPFLMKYYLFKDIWESVHDKKAELEIAIKSQEPQEQTIIPLDGLNEEEG